MLGRECGLLRVEGLEVDVERDRFVVGRGGRRERGGERVRAGDKSIAG